MLSCHWSPSQQTRLRGGPCPHLSRTPMAAGHNRVTRRLADAVLGDFAPDSGRGQSPLPACTLIPRARPPRSTRLQHPRAVSPGRPSGALRFRVLRVVNIIPWVRRIERRMKPHANGAPTGARCHVGRMAHAHGFPGGHALVTVPAGNGDGGGGGAMQSRRQRLRVQGSTRTPAREFARSAQEGMRVPPVPFRRAATRACG